MEDVHICISPILHPRRASPAFQCQAGWTLRCWRAWWIVLGGFGLTLPALVALRLTFADGVARMPSRTSWRDLIGAWQSPD
jgi:hypothetical protein